PIATRITRSSVFTVASASSAADEARGGEEAGVGDHPVVRSDRLTLDVPGPHQHLLGLGQAETGAGERLAELRHLHDAREVCDEDATRVQRLGGMLDDPTRLRQVQHHAVQARRTDALVHVPGIDAVPLEVAGAEERVHVSEGTADDCHYPLMTMVYGTHH